MALQQQSVPLLELPVGYGLSLAKDIVSLV